MARGHKRPSGPANAPASKKHKPQRTATLYVKNLNDKVASADLRVELYMMFSMSGHVVAINTHKSPQMRGQAHVAFANAESAAVALKQFQGREFLGKPLEIAYAKQESVRLQWLQRDLDVQAHE